MMLDLYSYIEYPVIFFTGTAHIGDKQWSLSFTDLSVICSGVLSQRWCRECPCPCLQVCPCRGCCGFFSRYSGRVPTSLKKYRFFWQSQSAGGASDLGNFCAKLGDWLRHCHATSGAWSSRTTQNCNLATRCNMVGHGFVWKCWVNIPNDS